MRFREIISERLSRTTPELVLNAFRTGPSDLQGLYHNYKLAYDDFDEWVIGRAAEMINTLKPWSEGSITLYRRLSTAAINTHRLGIHWAVSEETNADVHYGDYALQITVPQSAINWPDTIARAIGWWDSDQEISLHRGAMVKITRFYDMESGRTLIQNQIATT